MIRKVNIALVSANAPALRLHLFENSLDFLQQKHNQLRSKVAEKVQRNFFRKFMFLAKNLFYKNIFRRKESTQPENTHPSHQKEN